MGATEMFSAHQLQLTLIVLLSSKISDLKLKLLRASNTVSPGSVTPKCFWQNLYSHSTISKYQMYERSKSGSKSVKRVDSQSVKSSSTVCTSC